MGCTTAFVAVQLLALFFAALKWSGTNINSLAGMFLVLAMGLGVGAVLGMVAGKAFVKTPKGAGLLGREKKQSPAWQEGWEDIKGEKLIAL